MPYYTVVLSSQVYERVGLAQILWPELSGVRLGSVAFQTSRDLESEIAQEVVTIRCRMQKVYLIHNFSTVDKTASCLDTDRPNGVKDIITKGIHWPCTDKLPTTIK